MIWIKQFILRILSLLRKKILGNYARAILYKDLNNKYYLVDVQDMVVGRRLAYNGAYDSKIVEKIKTFLNEKSTVVILGTHVGAILIPMSYHVRKVYGFEANPDTFQLIDFNLRLNGVTNVQLNNVAIGEKSGEINFYINTVNSGGSKIQPENDVFYKRYDRPKLTQVPVRTLDSFSLQEEIDLMLIDIEGGEYNALKGMKNTLHSVNILQIEYVPRHLKLISKTNNIEFFSLIKPYFKTFQIGEDNKEYDIANVDIILQDFWDNNKGCDLLFFK